MAPGVSSHKDKDRRGAPWSGRTLFTGSRLGIGQQFDHQFFRSGENMGKKASSPASSRMQPALRPLPRRKLKRVSCACPGDALPQSPRPSITPEKLTSSSREADRSIVRPRSSEGPTCADTLQDSDRKPPSSLAESSSSVAPVSMPPCATTGTETAVKHRSSTELRRSGGKAVAVAEKPSKSANSAASRRSLNDSFVRTAVPRAFLATNGLPEAEGEIIVRWRTPGGLPRRIQAFPRPLAPPRTRNAKSAGLVRRPCRQTAGPLGKVGLEQLQPTASSVT